MVRGVHDSCISGSTNTICKRIAKFQRFSASQIRVNLSKEERLKALASRMYRL